MQNQRPALTLANGMVYVGYASHCDGTLSRLPDGVRCEDARQIERASTLRRPASEASIWQSGQGPAVDAEGNVYVVTGNGSWDGVP